MTNHDLCLYEELMLLALCDRSGTINSGWYSHAIAGAVLAELLLLERLEVDDDKIFVLDPDETGDPVLDECLRWITDASSAKSIQHWVGKITGMNGLKHRSVEGLCDRGILKADKDKVMLFFDRRIYPEIDPQPERDLVDRMAAAIESEAPLDPRTAVTIAIAQQTGLMKSVFTSAELKRYKARIEDICEGNDVGDAAKKAIEAQQAVLLFLMIMPVFIS